MGTFLFRLSEGFHRFEQWFNARFGWFFTNGMKNPDGRKSPPLPHGVH